VIAVPARIAGERLAMASLLAGIALFSVQEPIIKAMSGAYPVTETIAFRGVFALPVFTLLVAASGGLRLLLTERRWKLTGRGALMMLTYALYYLSLAELPITTATALWFTAPLFMVALSRVIVGERQALERWLAVLVGFGGVVVIVHPSSGTPIAAVLPLAAAATYALAQLIARRVGEGIPAPVISWYQNSTYVVGALVLSLVLAPLRDAATSGGPTLAFLLRPWEMPTLRDGLLLALVGPVAGIGSTLIVRAYRSAPPGRVGVLEYTMMLWAILWSVLVFGEAPSWAELAGASLIAASGAYALLRAGSDAVAPPAGDER